MVKAKLYRQNHLKKHTHTHSHTHTHTHTHIYTQIYIYTKKRKAATKSINKATSDNML